MARSGGGSDVTTQVKHVPPVLSLLRGGDDGVRLWLEHSSLAVRRDKEVREREREGVRWGEGREREERERGGERGERERGGEREESTPSLLVAPDHRPSLLSGGEKAVPQDDHFKHSGTFSLLEACKGSGPLGPSMSRSMHTHTLHTHTHTHPPHSS